jgi:hypothetical protein
VNSIVALACVKVASSIWALASASAADGVLAMAVMAMPNPVKPCISASPFTVKSGVSPSGKQLTQSLTQISECSLFVLTVSCIR